MQYRQSSLGSKMVVVCLGLGFKALLNDEFLAPIVEIVYGALTEQIIGMITWILVPQ